MFIIAPLEKSRPFMRTRPTELLLKMSQDGGKLHSSGQYEEDPREKCVPWVFSKHLTSYRNQS